MLNIDILMYIERALYNLIGSRPQGHLISKWVNANRVPQLTTPTHF